MVPHAGYRDSGPVAASGYACIAAVRHAVTRVVLLGPTHVVPVWGMVVSRADVFATPLGTVPIDSRAHAAILDLPQVSGVEAAHAREHSLAVQLPF
jgi:AmmeMemoRadiSam system protein B